MKQNFMKQITAIGAIVVLAAGCANQPVQESAAGTTNQTQTTSATVQQTQTSAGTTPSDAQSQQEINASASGEITEEEAKAIAFQHAQVVPEEVAAVRVQKEWEDGIVIYDVEFAVQNKEYDYEIKAEDGSIVSVDYEVEGELGTTPAGSAQILSETDAKQIVLSRVPGATEQSIRIQLDMEDGIQVYEGELIFNNIKYEFELNAQTGDILKWEQEN